MNDFYPHLLHIMEPNAMNRLVLKGDMEVTFAGIVDIGEFNFSNDDETDSELNENLSFPATLPNTQFPINFNITFGCADKEVSTIIIIFGQHK